jgi:hypothetical protein
MVRAEALAQAKAAEEAFTAELAAKFEGIALSDEARTLLTAALKPNAEAIQEAIRLAEANIAEAIASGKKIKFTKNTLQGPVEIEISLEEARRIAQASDAAASSFYGKTPLPPGLQPLTRLQVATPAAPLEPPSHELARYYLPERAEMQLKSIDTFFQKADLSRPPKGHRPVAIFQGGNPGAGKTSSGKLAVTAPESPLGAANLEDLQRRAININADDFKNFIPEYNGPNSNLVHAESADMAVYATNRARAEGRNMIIDGTLIDLPWALKQMQLLKEAGYDIIVVGSILPNSKAIGRAVSRFLKEGRNVVFQFIGKSTANQNLLQLAYKRKELADKYGIKRVQLFSTDVSYGEAPKALIDTAVKE